MKKIQSHKKKEKYFYIRKGKTYEEIYGIKKAKPIINKIKLSLTGKKYPKEIYPNKGMRNKKHSNESKIKNHNSHIGKTSHRKGINMEKEYGINKSKTIRKKISIKTKENMKKLSPEKRKSLGFKQGHTPWNKNLKLNEDHIKKLKGAWDKRKERGDIPWNKGKINVYSDTRLKNLKEERAKRILPKKDTKIEIKIQNFLKQLGIEFFAHQYIKEIEHGYQCDIFIPFMNLVIECDGNYWHSYPTGREIDNIRTKELIRKGFKVLRLWEFEIKSMNLNNFKEKLNEI